MRSRQIESWFPRLWMRRVRSLLLILVFVPEIGAADAQSPAASATREGLGKGQCGPEVRREALKEAATASPLVLTCSLTLQASDVVRRNLAFHGNESSGTTLECNGASIVGSHLPGQPWTPTVDIRSLPNRDANGAVVSWNRPSDVTIKNCTIDGRVQIAAMDFQDRGAMLYASSRLPDHTERAQASAPTRVSFLGVRFKSEGVIPLYIAPGSTYVTVKNSQFSGRSKAVAVYLDAESAHNEISESVFNVRTGREIIAIDGSAHNSITKNRFTLANQIGVTLYRNCGETGIVRHQTPSFNTVADNEFVYRDSSRPQPVVVGPKREWSRKFCHLDDGYPFGSSSSNNDDAQSNDVERNSVRSNPH